MRKILSIILCLTITFSCVNVFAASTDDEIKYAKQMITEKKNNTPDEEKTNEIFVRAMDNSETEKIINEALKGFEYEIVKQYELSKAYLVKFESVQKADEAIDILNARKDIKYAQPNYYISLPTSVGNGGFTAPIYTIETLTNISAKDIKKISIGCSKCGLGLSEFFISSPLIISNIVNSVKDIQFEKEIRTAGGGAGGWLYGMNFYMEDGTYIQFGTRIHIDKITYMALEHDAVIEIMKNYHDLIESIDSNEWATDYILECMEFGFLEDVSELNYKEPITREKFCEIIYNMISKSTDKKWSAPTAIPFNDTYNPKVASLYYADIIKGKADKQFAPNDFLTREEAATILMRTAEVVGIGFPENAYDTKIYNDEDLISDWAFSSVHYARKMGIMVGTSETEFSPQETYTVEQAIATIIRLYNNYNS